MRQYRYREGVHGEHCIDLCEQTWELRKAVGFAASKAEAERIIVELNGLLPQPIPQPVPQPISYLQGEHWTGPTPARTGGPITRIKFSDGSIFDLDRGKWLAGARTL